VVSIIGRTTKKIAFLRGALAGGRSYRLAKKRKPFKRGWEENNPEVGRFTRKTEFQKKACIEEIGGGGAIGKRTKKERRLVRDVCCEKKKPTHLMTEEHFWEVLGVGKNLGVEEKKGDIGVSQTPGD